MMVFLGIILLVAGGIVAFAVTAAFDGVDLQAIGYIMMAGGALALLVAAIQAAGWMTMSSRNKHFTRERHVSPDGTHVVDETHAS